jgi:hypothetical protein
LAFRLPLDDDDGGMRVKPMAVLAVAVLVAVGSVSTPGWGASRGGVASGAGVTARENPDNAVLGAIRQGAKNAGLGSVNAVGFRPDCSPEQGRVVVCRNPALHKNGARAVTLVGPNTCVVRTDPRVGGAQHGVNVMTKALRKCLA